MCGVLSCNMAILYFLSPLLVYIVFPFFIYYIFFGMKHVIFLLFGPLSSLPVGMPCQQNTFPNLLPIFFSHSYINVVILVVVNRAT